VAAIMLVMCFISLEVVAGLTSFYTDGLTGSKLAAFAVVTAFPVIVVTGYVFANRRSDRPKLALALTLGALACDLILLSFANGRL